MKSEHSYLFESGHCSQYSEARIIYFVLVVYCSDQLGKHFCTLLKEDWAYRFLEDIENHTSTKVGKAEPFWVKSFLLRFR
jgi:hypothetical protein